MTITTRCPHNLTSPDNCASCLQAERQGHTTIARLPKLSRPAATYRERGAATYIAQAIAHLNRDDLTPAARETILECLVNAHNRLCPPVSER